MQSRIVLGEDGKAFVCDELTTFELRFGDSYGIVDEASVFTTPSFDREAEKKSGNSWYKYSLYRTRVRRKV